MKRTWLRLACFAVAAVLCLSMTGCQALDDLKAKHATWCDGEDAFLWNGAIYRVLPDMEMTLSPSFADDKTLIVSDKDVPVLVARLNNVEMELSDDEVLAREHYYDFDDYYDYYDYYDATAGDYYCREDCYDSVVEALKSASVKYVKAKYTYQDVQTGGEAVYWLTQEEYEAVDAVLNDALVETLPTGASMQFETWVTLYQCREDESSEQAWISVGYVDEVYYLTEFDENGNTVLYYLKGEHEDAFESLLAAKVAADKAEKSE